MNRVLLTSALLTLPLVLPPRIRAPGLRIVTPKRCCGSVVQC